MYQNGSPILDDLLHNFDITFEQLPQILGPNWETVLDFWKFRSSLNTEQILKLYEYYRLLDYRLLDNDASIARKAVVSIIGERNKEIVWQVTYFPEFAVYEIIAMHKLIEDGYTFKFLPLFENL